MTGPVAAEAALAQECRAGSTHCLTIAYDMTLRPWAKVTADRLYVRRHDDNDYMLYACAMYNAEEHLDDTAPHRVLLGVHLKGTPRYDCLWQFGAPSRQAALAKLPCERARYDCRVVASDGELEPGFRPRGKTAGESGLPREMLNSLAPGDADAPTLWPPGLTQPELAVDGAPPIAPRRPEAILLRKSTTGANAPPPAGRSNAGGPEH